MDVWGLESGTKAEMLNGGGSQYITGDTKGQRGILGVEMFKQNWEGRMRVNNQAQRPNQDEECL